MGEITKIKIFPSIGIMRVGNSPDEYFVGPEIPGHYELPEGGFKDAQCRIKRQAARFRLYGYDDKGSKPVEITTQNAKQITWTVKLANKKASWESIYPKPADTKLRNEWYKGDRDDLNIKPSPHSLTGANQGPVKFDDGKFLKKENGKYVKAEPVLLGEMRTDELGHLLVLGGYGKAGGVEPEGPPGYPNFTVGTYNSPGWYDDIADGPVTATVTLADGSVFSEQDIAPAWVISAPPDFAPQLTHLTTFYDVLRQAALNQAAQKNWPEELIKNLKAPATPSFKDDVLPILQRVLDLYWVSDFVKKTPQPPDPPPGQQASHHFKSFTAAANADAGARQKLFGILKPPGPNPPKGSMPRMWGDDYQKATSQTTQTVLTPTQYAIMENWAKPEWVDPPPSAPPTPFENPEDLTRAALEACVGSALVPGIEAGRILRDKCDYTEPFRLNHDFIKEDGTKLEAGDLTKDMALPWHGDFANCRQETIAWWPAQRPDFVFRDLNAANNNESAFWPQDIIDFANGFHREEMTQKWHQLGFVVQQGDKFIETERDLVCADLFLILDRSNFSKNEVPDTFDNCFYVVIEGFKPSDFGITKGNLSDEELKTAAPVPVLTHGANGPETSGMTALPQELLLESVPFQDIKQRLTFVYRIEFKDTSDFKGIGYQKIALTVTKKHPTKEHTYSAIGELTLFEQSNPYMQDGPVSWLSEDVRVFKVLDGAGVLNIPFGTLEEDTDEAGAQSALAFIKKVVNEFNKDQTSLENHPFAQLETDQTKSALELAVKMKNSDDEEKRVFNFAIARVRYSGNVSATGVHVFFRLFTTAATGLDYHKATTYRRSEGDNPVALLGLQGGNVVSIPCYAEPRADTEENQSDGFNIKTLVASDKGERYCYFGCWLDFNQTTPRFVNPLNPSEKKSIQEQIRGLHQCLVAEIYFKDDPMPEGATPASNENLAQRNLLIVEAPNPGQPSSRLVQHTFEIRVTPSAPVFAAAANAALPADPHKAARTDELMIRWNNLPRSSQVTLYMPGAEQEVLRLAQQNYEAPQLERLDAQTIRCLPGDVTYVPLPSDRSENIPALLSIELPEGIRRGDEFNIVVHQV
ncbi:MAG TPA: LodA/GoxA family CTQ-dependent oxidase, partial [Pyrinomonadaceae bacterium]